MKRGSAAWMDTHGPVAAGARTKRQGREQADQRTRTRASEFGHCLSSSMLTEVNG